MLLVLVGREPSAGVFDTVASPLNIGGGRLAGPAAAAAVHSRQDRTM
jgi:hypothetical protein